MAFPVVVTTQLNAYHGIGGPYVNSAGTAVYLFGRYNANTTQVQCFKATDPATSWAGVGTNPTVASGNTIRQMAAYQYGDSIHVVTRDAAAANSNQLRYHLFNMATDTWELTNELIKTTYTIAGPVDDSIVTIVARSAGAKFVSYEGPQVLADIQRSRTYYAQNLGAAWSADIALDGGGNSHWFPQETILGAGNRVHFFLVNNTAEDLYQRTLNSANALEALPAAFDITTTNQSDEMVQRGVAYSASAGGTVVIVPYLDSFTPTINDVRFTSVDVPSPLTIRTDITTPQVPLGGLFRRNMSFAADGNTIYATFTNNSSNIYVQSSQDAGSWAAPALLVGAATATEVYSNIYTRLGSRKLGVCFTRDNTDIKYTEYTLNIAPSVMTDAPDRFNLVTKVTNLAFDNAAFSVTASVVTNSVGLLLTATTNAVLLVWTNVGGASDTISSVVVGSTALTFLGATDYRAAAGLRTELWGLAEAPSGILTISATIAGGNTTNLGIGAVTYTGHKTTGSPFGGIVTGSASDTAQASLIVSATVGNLAVFGFAHNTALVSNGAATTVRINTGISFPGFIVTEAAGALAVTASATADSTVFWGMLGVNLIQSVSAALKVIVSGRMSATDVIGTFTATGYVITVVKQGRLSATGATDTFSATGYALVRGSASFGGVVDLFSASGTVSPLAGVLGRLSATGASDTLSASGYLVVRGRLSATDAPDIFSLSAVTITPVHGSVAWTMRQDTAVINPRQPAGLTPGTLSNAGGGAGAKSKENVAWPTDLWDAREAYLLSLYPEGPHPAPELEDNAAAWQEYEDRKQQLVNLTAERAHAILELRESPDLATMKVQGAHIKELTAKIATLTGKQDFARFMRH